MQIFDTNVIPFIGRQKDMAALRSRIQQRGMTVVTGRPQIGKSRLLKELVVELQQEGSAQVGYHKGVSTASSLLYAAADLYELMLQDSTWREQLILMRKTQSSRLSSRVGRLIGEVLAEATPAKGAFQKILGSLDRADQELHSAGGRATLPRLAIDEAREILELAAIAGKNRPLVLVLDQWEDCLDMDHEARLLRSFLSDLQDWPFHLHILLHIRHPVKEQLHIGAITAWSHVQEFRECSSAVTQHVVECFEIAPESRDGRILFRWLRWRFPKALLSDKSSVLQMIDGNPAVLRRWQDATPTSTKDMKQLAIQAHQYMYPEIKDAFTRLIIEWQPNEADRSPLDLSLQLCFLQQALSRESWQELKPCLFSISDEAVLDLLHSRGLFEDSEGYPSLGLPRRQESALNWILHTTSCRIHSSRAFTALILKLASGFSSRQITQQNMFQILSLASLRRFNDLLEANRPEKLYIQAASTIFGRKSREKREALKELVASNMNSIGQDQALFVAAAISVAIEDAKEANNIEQRDALMQEFRALTHTIEKEPELREWLAQKLFNDLTDAKEEQQPQRLEKLLQELRDLARSYPQEAILREQLAKGLVNAMTYYNKLKQYSLRDSLLLELRSLARAYPKEPALRARLAQMLFNGMIYAKEETKLKRHNSLLEELRDLSRANPREPVLRAELASGIFNAINQALGKGDLDLRKTLMQELRNLSRAYPKEPILREELVKALVNTSYYNIEENKDQHDEYLLEELRELARIHPLEPIIREGLALGLVNWLDQLNTNAEERKHALSLLDELFSLAKSHPSESRLMKIYRHARKQVESD